jgi:hypothetical protein
MFYLDVHDELDAIDYENLDLPTVEAACIVAVRGARCG